MAFQNNQDPRPKDRSAWIAKFRKVIPASLSTPGITQKNRTSVNARKSLVTTGLEPYTGPWENTQVVHLLRRALFGVRKSDLDHFKSMSMDQAVDQLLTPSVAPSYPVNDYQLVEPQAVDPVIILGETWINAPHGGDIEGYRIISLKG